MHITDHIVITDLPRECVTDCSHSGACDADVADWLKRLDFTVDRVKAIRGLREYGAWTLGELQASTDEDLASRVLWLACNDFSEFMTYAEDADFDPPAGSDVFSLS